MSGEQNFYLGNVTNVNGTGNIGSINFGGGALPPTPEQIAQQLAQLRAALAGLRGHLPADQAQRLDQALLELDPAAAPQETEAQRGARLGRALETARRVAETAGAVGPGVLALVERVMGMVSGH
ncbi:hypothetical protein [Kitasatospora cineracea]|uniref:hypothetical protein n=1 Tax=Kitasatospora cineracea TaxID=88074 RepID=UPI0038248299